MRSHIHTLLLPGTLYEVLNTHFTAAILDVLSRCILLSKLHWTTVLSYEYATPLCSETLAMGEASGTNTCAKTSINMCVIWQQVKKARENIVASLVRREQTTKRVTSWEKFAMTAIILLNLVFTRHPWSEIHIIFSKLLKVIRPREETTVPELSGV